MQHHTHAASTAQHSNIAASYILIHTYNTYYTPQQTAQHITPPQYRSNAANTEQNNTLQHRAEYNNIKMQHIQHSKSETVYVCALRRQKTK